MTRVPENRPSSSPRPPQSPQEDLRETQAGKEFKYPQGKKDTKDPLVPLPDAQKENGKIIPDKNGKDKLTPDKNGKIIPDKNGKDKLTPDKKDNKVEPDQKNDKRKPDKKDDKDISDRDKKLSKEELKKIHEKKKEEKEEDKKKDSPELKASWAQVPTEVKAQAHEIQEVKAPEVSGVEASKIVNQIREVILKMAQTLRTGTIGEKTVHQVDLKTTSEVPSFLQGASVMVTKEAPGRISVSISNLSPANLDMTIKAIETQKAQLQQLIRDLEIKQIAISELRVGEHIIALPPPPAVSPSPFSPSFEGHREGRREEGGGGRGGGGDREGSGEQREGRRGQ